MTTKPPLNSEALASLNCTDAREIPDYPGYAVSPDGRVFSCRCQIRIAGKRGGISGYSAEWRELKQARAHGYPYVELRNCNAIKKVKVHAMVLMAYVGPRPDSCQVCHANGIRHDNRLENLRWGSQQENTQDKVLHGSQRGERNPKAKLTDEIVAQVFRLAVEGESSPEIAARFGVDRNTIISILRGAFWDHVERPAELLRQIEVAGSLVKRGIWMSHARRKGLSFDTYAQIQLAKGAK